MSGIPRLGSLLLVAVLLCHALTAHAQTPLSSADETTPSGPAGSTLRIDAKALLRLHAASGQETAAAAAPQIPRAPRGVLPALYAGLGTLQALDAHSTLRAVSIGFAERNPIMRWTAEHPAALVAVKAAATAGTIVVAERIRRKHPKRAIAFIAAVNAGYALVVIHNYRALARAD